MGAIKIHLEIPPGISKVFDRLGDDFIGVIHAGQMIKWGEAAADARHREDLAAAGEAEGRT